MPSQSLLGFQGRADRSKEVKKCVCGVTESRVSQNIINVPKVKGPNP